MRASASPFAFSDNHHCERSEAFHVHRHLPPNLDCFARRAMTIGPQPAKIQKNRQKTFVFP
jgi:hypothetical protein